MRAGAMDRQITIQRRVLTKDSVGQDVESWVTDATVWCQVIPVGGKERLTSAHEVIEFDTRFRIRYRSSLDTTYRVVFEGQEFDIFSIAEIGRREGLEIMGKCRG